MTGEHIRSGGPLLLFALAVAVYAWQASDTPLLDRHLAARDHYLEAVARQDAGQPTADNAAAASYWSRYPDVADDAYYGRGGPLGAGGALQHYRDHGQREGRVWRR